ncbi:MAG: hypothetical protein WEC34_15860 [Acidimicrobiia bacterium]
MPNLLPDWTLTLPWDLGDWNLRESGRLFWSLALLIIGVIVVLTLMKPPKLQRPFKTSVGVALFFVIIVGTLVLGTLIPDLQRTIILLGMLAVVAHALLMVASRRPRDPDEPATWAECIAGAVGVFALMTLAYAIVPHEWLTFANADLEWGDSSKFVFQSNQEILGFVPINYPFSLDFPALRDIVVSLIYGVFLVGNVKLFSLWQARNEVPAESAEPEKTSRFGRPLRNLRRRREAAPASATAAAATSAPTEGA